MMGSGPIAADASDFDAVFALIALAADPKAFKARVDELRAVSAEATKLSAEAKAADTAVKGRETAAAAKLKEAETKLEAAVALQADLKTRGEKATAREVELGQAAKDAHAARKAWEEEEERRQKAVILGERTFQDSIRDRLADLGRRESVAAAATQAAETLMSQATKLKEDYEARLAKMVAMAQGVKA